MWRQSWTSVALCAALLMFFGVAHASENCDDAGNRIDCGYAGMAQQECEAKGCCWVPAEFAGAPHVDLPWCFKPNAEPSEYHVTSLERNAGDVVQAQLQVSKTTQPYLGDDVQALNLDIEPISHSVLRVRITDASGPRWEVPGWLFASDVLSGNNKRQLQEIPLHDNSGSRSNLYNLSIKEDPYSLEVARATDEDGKVAVVFNSTGTRLVYKDQYLEMSTWVDPEVVLFGAGERASATLHLERNGMPRTLWNHDLGPTFPEQNMYGSHPLLLALQPDGSAWGMLLLNSNAMDIVPSRERVSWRTTGGVLDLFLLLGPTPLDVMDQLTSIIGRPAMMPYWSLGWHQCKYGYRSVWEVEEVVANYSRAGLPLEAVWTDIDHMDAWRDFTFHPQNFPMQEMQRFVADLHSKGQRWMPIVDPGIKVDPGYPAYDQGLREKVFMRGVDGDPYLGWVWPGACHFPDFFNPDGRAYFARQLEQHHSLVPWAGIWIDMNEVSNFCTGDVCQRRPNEAERLRDDPPWVCHLDCRDAEGLNATQRGWQHPPYDVSSSLQRLPLGTKAMSVLATHHDGSVQYNTHQLYGLSAVLTISKAVKDIAGKRPFVLSRASYLGTGAYASTWTGDNSATWTQMAWSIPGVLSIGLWGIPMAGADICGFQGDTTPELCARWAALGAFYPFSRDHADLHSGYQELYRWPETTAAGKKALGMRYRLLPYLYTALHTAHNTGAPVMRPLFMNFPGDANTHKLDRQFMVGDALLVSPVLEEGARSVEAYFPPGTWHSLWDKGEVVNAGAGGKTVKLDAPLDTVPLHMKGDTALVMQQEALTTAEVKRSPMTVVVALAEVLQDPPTVSAALGADESVHISGHVYNDGGEELEVGESLCNFLHISASIRPELASNTHTAAVVLQFGSPAQLLESSDNGCRPVRDLEATTTSSDVQEWPALAAVEVLGWRLPAEGLVVEVVERTDTCGGLEVVQRVAVEPSSMRVGAGGLRIDLSEVNHHLECPFGVRLIWSSAISTATA